MAKMSVSAKVVDDDAPADDPAAPQKTTPKGHAKEKPKMKMAAEKRDRKTQMRLTDRLDAHGTLLHGLHHAAVA